ncbi:hypothetical protein, partial [Escherichia coli]|uniref:hypothetical protein n=1 Tax=Escherichia coli TaxID=562 RepID=UPI0013D6F1FF
PVGPVMVPLTNMPSLSKSSVVPGTRRDSPLDETLSVAISIVRSVQAWRAAERRNWATASIEPSLLRYWSAAA